ncbi:MAG: nitrite reductase (NAD(P)H) small subunit [Dehalococcoidales bacterium]|nr:nitrite reductase (NAD(P)H) small subunit [Dehalococcoidales bacterium]
MAGFSEVLTTGELASGQMKQVSIDGKQILLARVGDTYYATDNTCPHLKGNLAKGKMEGTVVTCPLHRSQFDLKDGHVVSWTGWTGIKLALAKTVRPPKPLKVYEVRVEGDKVMVGPERITAKKD